MKKNDKVSDIFVNYAAKLRKVVSKIVRPEDIDDIVQDTFVKSYQAQLDHEIEYVRTYMLTTAKNLALNHVAKSANKFNDSIEEFVEPPVELNTTFFEDEFATKERFLLFCRATEQLSGQVRKCFILKKVYGLSQKEIATYLDLSESTVEKHVAKGLLKSVQYIQKTESGAAKAKLRAALNDNITSGGKVTVTRAFK